jgi:hypothetical protein
MGMIKQYKRLKYDSCVSIAGKNIVYEYWELAGIYQEKTTCKELEKQGITLNQLFTEEELKEWQDKGITYNLKYDCIEASVLIRHSDTRLNLNYFLFLVSTRLQDHIDNMI